MSSKELEASEKEKELIEKVAKRIVDSDFDFFALLFLQSIKPLSWIGGELAYFTLAPYLPLLEDKGYDFLDTFEKRQNIERLIRRVESLHKEKVKEKERTKGPNFAHDLRERLEKFIRSITGRSQR